MRRLLRGILLTLAAVMLMFAVFQGLSQREHAPDAAATGSAAQGLMLVDEDSSVYVLAVTDQSAAFTAGVQPGDYILRADDVDITDTAQLDALFDGSREAMELLVLRSGGERKLILRCR